MLGLLWDLNKKAWVGYSMARHSVLNKYCAFDIHSKNLHMWGKWMSINHYIDRKLVFEDLLMSRLMVKPFACKRCSSPPLLPIWKNLYHFSWEANYPNLGYFFWTLDLNWFILSLNALGHNLPEWIKSDLLFLAASSFSPFPYYKYLPALVL